MATPLLERDAELAVLDAALDAARDGAGSVVLVSGEAGIGKTSVVRAFRRRAGGRGRVLAGACDDLLSPRTLGPLRDAARDAPRGPLAGALAAGDRDGVLTAVGDELSDPRSPTVLVVEDVHWADDATLDVLRHAGRRIADQPALLLVTYRDDEVGPALHRLLGGLTGDAVRRLPLRPLSRAAVAHWAGGTAATSAPLYRLTGGNPFYVSELLAAPEGDAVPATVVDAVLARVRRLDPATQRALEQLAVVPTRVELALARALLGDLAVVAEAERAGVLEVRATAVAFRHELARRAVEGATAATTRIRAHEQVLAALTASADPDPARIVHHAVPAGDDAAVVAHAPDAARRAARAGAQSQAATLYAQALARSALLSPVEHATVCEAHAWTLFHCNRRHDAVRAAGDAVALRERLGGPPELGRALATLAVQQWTDLRPAAAAGSADRAVQLLEAGGDSPALASALFHHGLVLINIDREAEGRARVEAAMAMDERRGTRTLHASCLVYRGRARLQEGDPGGVADMHAGIEVARAAGDHEAVMIGYINLVGSLWRQGRYAELERHLADHADYGRQRDFPTHDRARAAYAYRLRAMRGDWDAAEEGLRALVDDPEGAGTVTRHALPGLAQLAVRRGRPDAAALVSAAHDNGVRADSLQAVVPAVVAALELAWLTGEPEPARSAGRALLATTDRPGRRRDHAALQRWLQRLGDPAEPGPGCPEELAAGLRGHWRAAAAAWERVGDPYERALELAGSGEPEPMLEALRAFDALGAGPMAARVRGALRARGLRGPRGPQSTTRRNPAGLTGRQLEILGLLAQGRTNGEIADRLVLSVRTVDHHVSAVLAKLGVGSRHEAARAAADLLA